MASRYLATVRRAISMPASRSFSTMVSSDRYGGRLPHRSIAGCGDAPPRRNALRRHAAPAIAEVKKYFSSKMPRLVAMYLLAVTRDTVEFVHADRFGDGLEVERAQMLRPRGQKTRPAAARSRSRP